MHGFWDEVRTAVPGVMDSIFRPPQVTYATPPLVPERPTLPALPEGEWFSAPSGGTTLLLVGGVLVALYLLTQRRRR